MTNVCPKCGGKMIKGFVMELPTGREAVSTWVEGDVEKSFWTGIKFRKKRRMPIVAYCCDKCGYIEYYADLSKPSIP